LSSPRSVLYLHSSAGRYGADRQLELLATGLDPARYRALAVLAEDGPLAGALRSAGIEVFVRPLAVVRRELVSVAGLSRLAAAWAADAGGLGRLARSRGVALVHTNTSVTLGGAGAARVAGVPHVWHVREVYAGFERWWPAYRRLLATADMLPCVSGAAAAQFGPVGRAHVEVVHDGLAVDVARAERGTARAALGVDGDAFAVAVLGRLSSWKGQEVVVDAVARLPGSVALVAGEAWRGDPRPRRELAARAQRLGVADRVRLLGFREDVDVVLGAADVVAVPSTAPDPLPNSALEAAAAGCCVVASAHGGLPEIVRDGETGVLVAPGDAGALAEALAELRDDPARRERLGAAARADVRARFAPERLLERVQALYDRLL
jgi:glycosyltransferase involved in cell wall biosynthesis